MPRVASEVSEKPVHGDAGSDESLNKFCLVTVAFLRAKQLQNGARPRVEPSGHKFQRVAMAEVAAGLISWSAAGAVEPR
jgi:DNA-directed RNA polymerase omega subunit